MLTVTLYQDDADQDKFKVFLTGPDGQVEEVTDDYEVFAVKLDDNRSAWAVARRI